MATRKIYLKNTREAINLFGERDENIKNIEKSRGVQIFTRQDPSSGDFTMSVRGNSASKVDKAVTDIENLRAVIFAAESEKSENAFEKPSQGFLGEVSSGDTIYTSFMGKAVRPKTPNQKKYLETIFKNDVTFAIGPAGTGKTYLAVASALKMLRAGDIAKIVITRPVVEAGEKLGFLPGALEEKINPYLRPIYDAFFYLLGGERFNALRAEGTLEIVPLAYMRGRTLEKAFIILDEAQNTTIEQMKMFLTRMGIGSKVVVTGDQTQIDIENPKKSGLIHARKVLKNIEGIEFAFFNEEDIVRHAVVKKIVKAYAEL
ncbi:MAG: PhoH family protein [Elusimicrobia bacterium]|nr:PhoH family protein [Elusimicrobiota bacterium]